MSPKFLGVCIPPQKHSKTIVYAKVGETEVVYHLQKAIPENPVGLGMVNLVPRVL